MKSNLLFLFSIVSVFLLSSYSYAEVCYEKKTSIEYKYFQQQHGNTCSMVGPLNQSDSFNFCCSGPIVSQQTKTPQPVPDQNQNQNQNPGAVANGNGGSSVKRPSQSRKAPREESSEGSQSGTPGENILNYRGEIKGNYQSGVGPAAEVSQAVTQAIAPDKQCSPTFPKFHMHFATMEEAEGFSEANGSRCGVNGSIASHSGYDACCEDGYEPKNGLTAAERTACNEARQELQQCEDDRGKAESRCDPDSGDLGPYIKGLKAGNMFGTQAMGMTMGIQGVCEKAAGLMTGLNTALAAFQGVCESGRNSCMTSCQNVLKKIRSCPMEMAINQDLQTSKPIMEKNLSDCRGYGSRLNESAQSVNMALGSFQQAQQCAAMTKAMNMTVCTQNPFAPGCAGANQTCDNPTFAATNPVCIGLRNPGGSATTQVALPTPGGSGGLPDLKSSGGFTGENIGAGLDGMDGALAGGGPGGPGAPVGEDPGGKKGSGAPLNPNGGGGQGGGGAGGGGGGYDQEKIQVYGGTYGSGGGAGAFGGGRMGSNGTAGNRYPGNASGGTAFSKFNPAMAGMSRSGLTGANGASIWQKVSNRYKAKEHSMKGVTP